MPTASRVLIGFCGVLFAALGLVINVYFWLQVMRHDTAAQALWVALAIGSFLAKVSLPAVAHAAGRNIWHSFGVLTVVFYAALVFDVAGGLGFSAMTKDAAAREARETAAKRGQLTAELAAAEKALSDLPTPAGSVARLRADAAAAETRAGDCKRPVGPEARTLCAAAQTARGAVADAEAHDAAARAVTAARAALAGLPEARDADPQATALVRAFATVGLNVKPEHVATALGILALILIELGGAFGLQAALAKPAPAPSPPAPKQPSGTPTGNLRPAAPMTPHKRARGSTVDVPEAIRKIGDGTLTVKGVYVEHDNWVSVSQGALAEALGVSKATANKAIASAVAAGRLEIDASPKGTRLRVVGG